MPSVDVETGGEAITVDFPDGISLYDIKASLDEKFAPVKQFMSHVWQNMSPLDKAAVGTMMIPIVGDATGLAADIDMYVKDPESRTVLNGLFTAAGVLPLIPAASQVKKGLDMSQSARMQRAKDMGFPDSTSYRGLSEPYKEEKISHLTWTTDNPEYASSYADGGPDGRSIDMGGNVMPIKVKSSSPFDFGFRSQFTEVKYGDMLDRLRLGANDALRRGDITRDEGLDILDKIEDMRDAAPDAGDMRPVYSWWNNKPEIVDRLKEMGHDSLTAKEGISDNISTTAIFDPKNIRSVNAAFDPAKKESSNLLAEIGGATVLTGGVAAHRNKEDEYKN